VRISQVAREVGTTTRTIRYYEEIGLLRPSDDREHGAHRTYTEADVDRLRVVLQLKDLLGVSLDELKTLVEAEDARAALRAEWRDSETNPGRRREILGESLGHIDRQLRLLRARQAAIAQLEHELVTRRKRVQKTLRELGS
jgi:DNA-binding transcriptional MerR regulator